MVRRQVRAREGLQLLNDTSDSSKHILIFPFSPSKPWEDKPSIRLKRNTTLILTVTAGNTNRYIYNLSVWAFLYRQQWYVTSCLWIFPFCQIQKLQPTESSSISQIGWIQFLIINNPCLSFVFTLGCIYIPFILFYIFIPSYLCVCVKHFVTVCFKKYHKALITSTFSVSERFDLESVWNSPLSNNSSRLDLILAHNACWLSHINM